MSYRMLFEDYPPSKSWDPSTANDQFDLPRTVTGQIVSWYDPANKGPNYGTPPASWTNGDERQGLIGSIVALQRERFYLNTFDVSELKRWSNAKLEYVFGQMLLAAADGRAPAKVRGPLL